MNATIDLPPTSVSISSGLAEELPDRLDPRLQRLLLRRHQGQVEPARASTGVDEVAVVARVTDLAAWENLSEVRVGSSVREPDADTWIVTGRIPVLRIESVRNQPFVRTLKAAQPL